MRVWACACACVIPSVLVPPVLWIVEATSCCWSALAGWYENHKPLTGRHLCEYPVLLIKAVVSPGFVANAGSFAGTFLYFVSSAIMSREYYESDYLDDGEMVEYWEAQGFVAPTYSYLTYDDTLQIQIAADFCYLASAICCMYVAWGWFDPAEWEEDEGTGADAEGSYGVIASPGGPDEEGVQLVSTGPKADSVHVTLLDHSPVKVSGYGAAETAPVHQADADATYRFDVKRAHIQHLRWLFCGGWKECCK